MAWRKATVLAAATVTAAIAGVLASPSYAAAVLTTGQIPLHSTQIPTTAAQFGEKQCDDAPFVGLPLGKDGWHFVLPDGSGDSFVSLSLTFNDGVNDIAVLINTVAPTQSSGTGWYGFITDAGMGQPGKHAYVITDSGWTLKAPSSAIVTNPGPGPDPEKPGDPGSFFNLSHVCVGTKTTTPTPSITTTTTKPATSPGTSSSTTDVTTPGSPTPTDPGLPTTGAALGGVIVAGAALIAGGAVLVALRRRRDAAETPTAGGEA